ncbi:MAG: ABC transporter permease [Fuerstiella sp.]
MKKILTIARREYQAMVATKAFVIGLAMMPVLMLGGMYVPGLLKGMQSSEERKIAVVDFSGQLFAPLSAAAGMKNAMTQAAIDRDANGEETEAASEEEKDRKAKQSLGLDDINTYVLELVLPAEFNDEKRLELSDRIRKGDIHGFVEIPADILESKPVDLKSLDMTKVDAKELIGLPDVIYCSQDSAISDVKSWLQGTLTQLVRAERLKASGVDEMILLELERRANVQATGLYEKADDGTVIPERKPDELTSIFLPMGIMMLMFMIVMMSAQPMLESVLEEKSLRISEVLLGSANARQLMIGKLIGNVCGSLTVFGLYAGGALAVASAQGYLDIIPLHVIPFFIIYQVLAVLLFSSIFMAIGASVSQLREAQSLLLPVWMVMMFPLMVWIMVVREPNGTLATTLSFFPPSTPLMMTLRLATGAIIPVWQIVCSILLLVFGTFVGITAASRIYRVAILYQGKTPKFSDMLSWIIKDPAG